MKLYEILKNTFKSKADTDYDETVGMSASVMDNIRARGPDSYARIMGLAREIAQEHPEGEESSDGETTLSISQDISRNTGTRKLSSAHRGDGDGYGKKKFA